MTSLTLPQTVLDQAQASHEANMWDRCDIHTVTSEWDEAAQESIETVTPVHLDLPCRIPAPTGQGRVLITGETVTPVATIVRIPLHTAGVEEDMRVTVTACRQDPSLVGTHLWVSHNRLRSLNTARYLECREIR